MFCAALAFFFIYTMVRPTVVDFICAQPNSNQPFQIPGQPLQRVWSLWGVRLPARDLLGRNSGKDSVAKVSWARRQSWIFLFIHCFALPLGLPASVCSSASSSSPCLSWPPVTGGVSFHSWRLPSGCLHWILWQRWAKKNARVLGSFRSFIEKLTGTNMSPYDEEHFNNSWWH